MRPGEPGCSESPIGWSATGIGAGAAREPSRPVCRRRPTDYKGQEVLEPGPDPGVELLLAALDGLSATDQELLRLSSWDELSRDEIASVLGIKQNAVDQRLHRARSRLRVRFERLANDTSRPTPEEASACDLLKRADPANRAEVDVPGSGPKWTRESA